MDNEFRYIGYNFTENVCVCVWYHWTWKPYLVPLNSKAQMSIQQFLWKKMNVEMAANLYQTQCDIVQHLPFAAVHFTVMIMM